MRAMRVGCLLLLALGAALAPRAALTAAGPEIVDVRKIWDRAPHNAFTDLIRFQDRWLCVFREGRGHVSPDGALRVIESPDGVRWQSAALLTSPTSDLRDAKITLTPEGRLMLSGAEATHPPATASHHSVAWYSRDGREWGERRRIGDPDMWLWRTEWHDGAAYSIGYSTYAEPDRNFVRLYRSKDGGRFEPLVERLHGEGYPNEHSLVFEPNGTAKCLLRRDGTPNSGLLGESRPPYTQWRWRNLGTRIGGPEMIRLPDGRLLAAVRLYDGKVRTSLCRVHPNRIEELLPLPSGGDTSYAGMVWHEGLLWISYYSSHEGKTSIYLARVRV
ncbi:MAG: exo-alpha-sialidase [Armatimonadota bacterium]